MSYMLVLDVDKCPADSLPKAAAYDVDKLFSKASTISEGAVFNIHHSLLKKTGPRIIRHSPRGYYTVTFNRGKR